MKVDYGNFYLRFIVHKCARPFISFTNTHWGSHPGKGPECTLWGAKLFHFVGLESLVIKPKQID